MVQIGDMDFQSLSVMKFLVDLIVFQENPPWTSRDRVPAESGFVQNIRQLSQI